MEVGIFFSSPRTSSKNMFYWYFKDGVAVVWLSLAGWAASGWLDLRDDL